MLDTSARYSVHTLSRYESRRVFVAVPGSNIAVLLRRWYILETLWILGDIVNLCV